MNILAHMDTDDTSKELLLDDDCSQEEYLKTAPYSVEEFMGAKRKSTDEEQPVAAAKKPK